MSLRNATGQHPAAKGTGSAGNPPASSSNALKDCYESWNWKKCRRQKMASDRLVYANNPARNAEQEFCDNEITNTKYTMLSFLPKTLAEQFSRNMNRYFLLIACLQLIKTITPVNPLTTWAPLVIIFGITAVKELVDDLGRRRGDNAANTRLYTVVRAGQRQQIFSKDIQVGDILRLQENDEIPCDLVLLSSSDPLGNCFIQTTNLDGESNLKVRSASSETKQLLTDAAIGGFTGVVKCGPPDEKIYTFDSQLRPGPDSRRVTSLSAEQLLLQATHLRNTDFVYGIAVYTGNETKFGNNKKTPPPKLTKTDRMIDRFSLYIFIFQLTLVVIFGIVGDVWRDKHGYDHWYLGYPKKSPGYEVLIIPARFLLLNSTMIPISLKVTLDLCKLFYAKFINNDLELYDEETDTPAHSNSTALSEDLGQIEYVLTDKTGTLTENVMMLKVCTIGGTQYGHFNKAGNLLRQDSSRDNAGHGVAKPGGVLNDIRLTQQLTQEAQQHTPYGGLDFFRNMAVNNSVVPSVHDDGTRTYKASSPDEEALVKAAASFNVTMLGRDGPFVTISVLGAIEKYEIEHELEFTSDRKRMSVVARVVDSKKRILFIKGADDTVLPRLAPGQNISGVVQQIDGYAEAGLRTLVLGMRPLTDHDYQTWRIQFDEANSAMQDRQALKERTYDLIERDIVFVGATAIEDRLQRNVPETIALLSQAGIKFWMCTGDKFSTALTISQTCNLKQKHNLLVTVDGKDEKEVGSCLRQSIVDMTNAGFIGQVPGSGRSQAIHDGTSPQGYTVIIRGDSIEFALKHHYTDFCTLMLAAVSAVCCRVTPKQKAELVKVVKTSGKTVLAIGDGGNDVSMIQEAHVGVGIKGKEGLQASRAADYVVVLFNALQRLVLVHGRYSYYRTSLVAQYSFYKSFLFCFLQIGYGFLSGYSGVSMFNSLCVAAYNALLFVPVVFFFVDKDLEEDTVLSTPQAYVTTREGRLMNLKTFGVWFARAFVQSFIVMAIGLSIVPGTDSAAYESMGLLIFNGYLLLQDVTMLLELRGIAVHNLVSVFGLHLIAIIALIIVNNSTAFSSFVDYYSFNVTLGDPVFWFGVFLIAVATFFPVFLYQSWLFNYASTPERQLQHYELLRKVADSREALLRDVEVGSRALDSPSVQMHSSPWHPRHGQSIEMVERK